MKETKILEILTDYGLKMADLAASDWERVLQERDEQELHRLARVTAVNKLLKRQRGCEPLSWDNNKNNNKMENVSDSEEEEDAQKQQREGVGLEREEWDCIKGHHGTMLGVGLSKTAFERMLRKCRSKKALTMRGDEHKSRLFLLEELKKYATAALSRHNKDSSKASLLQRHAKEVVRLAKTSSGAAV
jgi:hypothetical protein